MWKILYGVTSNDVKVNFQPKSRTGIKAVVPSLTANYMKSHQTFYDNSFAVLGPKQLNSLDRFKMFKSRFTAFLLTVPDKPPVKGYGVWPEMQQRCGAVEYVDGLAVAQWNYT